MTTLRGFGRAWDRITIYLPVILMGVLALGTYWLARNTPSFAPAAPVRAPTHDADYFLHNFSVKSFDASGRLKSEMHGEEARHFPDTDTTEIEQPRIRAFNENGAQIVATARRAVSNSDGSQVQLIGNAVVTRDEKDAQGQPLPHLEIRGEYLHFYVNEERLTSNQPVILERGADRFEGDKLSYDNLDRVLQLTGRVKGTLPGHGGLP